MKTKITTTKSDIVSATKKAILFVPKKPIIPLQSCFEIKFTDNRSNTGDFMAEVVGSDGWSSVVCTFPYSKKGEEAPPVVHLSAYTFHSLITLLPEEQVEITFTVNNKSTTMNIKSGTSKHKMQSVVDDSVSLRIKYDDTNSLRMAMPGELIVTASSVLAPMVNDDDTTGLAGMGVQYDKNTGNIYMWGGDGHLMGGVSIHKPMPETWQDFNLPLAFAKNLHKVFAKSDEVAMMFNGKHCKMETHSCSLTTTVLTEKFPAVLEIINRLSEATSLISVSTADMRMALSRLKLHKDAFLVKMTLTESHMEIESKDETGSSSTGHETIPYASATKVTPLSIGFNVEKIPVVFENTDTDTASMSFRNERSAVFINTQIGSINTMFLAMPFVL